MKTSPRLFKCSDSISVIVSGSDWELIWTALWIKTWKLCLWRYKKTTSSRYLLSLTKKLSTKSLREAGDQLPFSSTTTLISLTKHWATIPSLNIFQTQLTKLAKSLNWKNNSLATRAALKMSTSFSKTIKSWVTMTVTSQPRERASPRLISQCSWIWKKGSQTSALSWVVSSTRADLQT